MLTGIDSTTERGFAGTYSKSHLEHTFTVQCSVVAVERDWGSILTPLEIVLLSAIVAAGFATVEQLRQITISQSHTETADVNDAMALREGLPVYHCRPDRGCPKVDAPRETVIPTLHYHLSKKTSVCTV